MTGDQLARSYLAKARARRRVLVVLAEEQAWSDVVLEAQELVELALKAALRIVGIDPPKWHDVGPILVERAPAFPEPFAVAIPRLAEISRWLRRERELPSTATSISCRQTRIANKTQIEPCRRSPRSRSATEGRGRAGRATMTASLTPTQVPPGWAGAFDEAVRRQESLREQGEWWSKPRSLLGVIGQRHLETIHSSMLAWLIDPNERHGLGTMMLERFLRRSQLPTDHSLSKVRVDTEVGCGGEHGPTGAIDILVTADEWTLVIENKLWAGQHGMQLNTYFDAYRELGADFVYLTPDGVMPRSTRGEVLDAFRPVSWRQDVIPDLREAIACAVRHGREPLAAREYLCALEEELL